MLHEQIKTQAYTSYNQSSGKFLTETKCPSLQSEYQCVKFQNHSARPRDTRKVIYINSVFNLILILHTVRSFAFA